MNWNKSKCLKICQSNLLDYVLFIKIKRELSSVNNHSFLLFLTNFLWRPSSAVEIQTDGSCTKKIDMLWLEIRCYDCVRIRDKLKDVIYSLLALFDRPTWATVMLRDLSKSNHKVCRLFFARIFANDWRKHLVFVSELTFYTCKLSSSASCDLEAKHKNSTNGSDNKSPSTNLLLHPIEIQHNKSITLNINNGADQKKKCQNTSVNKGKEVNFLKRKQGKEEKKVSLEDINSYISRSFTLTEAAECLKVSRSTLKRKCRQLGISQWQPNNRIKRFRRTSQSKKVSEISSKLEVASLKSISSTLDDDVVNQCMQAPCTSKTEPKFPSQSKKVILGSISLRPDDVSQNKSVYGDLEAKHKNSTNGSDNKSPSTNLLLHPIEIQHNKSITLNINNGADQKKKCQNTSVNKGKEVNFLKRKRGKEEKKVSLEDINSYISRSFTLIEAAECLKVSRSTLKRKCRQLGISQWQPNNRIKRFRRTSQSKKVSEISSKLEVASLKSISSTLDDDVVNQCMQAPCTSKTEPKFPSQSKTVILDSISLRPDDVSQNKSVYGTQSDEGLLSRLKAATLNSIVSMKDLSQYMTKYDTHKSEKVAQFGSSSRDVKQYKCLNQNLSDHRSLVLFPITHSHACNRTTSDTNKGNTITNDKLVESNEEIFVHSSAIGQYSSVFYPPLKQARVQDGMTSLIKATYKDDMVRFHFSFKENITGLKKEVARRLNLKLGTFKMKYLDDEDEWTLLASDLDWQEFIYISRSSRKNAVRLLVQDIQREEEDKGDLEITLLKL